MTIAKTLDQRFMSLEAIEKTKNEMLSGAYEADLVLSSATLKQSEEAKGDEDDQLNKA